MHSPKLDRSDHGGWYRYYAGFSADFVSEGLGLLRLEKGATVIDPWHGSGTTGVKALEHGYNSVGFDANPALVVVARGRTLGREAIGSLPALLDEIMEQASSMLAPSDDDPLRVWLDRETAGRLRGLEKATYRLLVDHVASNPLARNPQLIGFSSLAAFFYVALFEVTRAIVAPYRSSNPTWLRIRGADGSLTADSATVRALLASSVTRLAAALRIEASAAAPTSKFDCGDSTCLPVNDASADGALTSPPYMTRIDYVVATRPELAILGYGEPDLRALRARMLGTPTITDSELTSPDCWGIAAAALLSKVASHPSRASATYYRRFFHQYFDGLWRSLRELRRVVKPGGRALIVIQDSYYKELRVDLATIVTEMGQLTGWQTCGRIDFPSRRTMARVNPASAAYRADFTSTETVLTLL